MSATRWALVLLRRVAPPERAEDVLGDLEEAHRARVERRGRVIAEVLTGLEALELAAMLLRERLRGRWSAMRSGTANRARPNDQRVGGGALRPRVSWLDIKLGLRMLVKYPGLTLAGGLALAFAIALGAAYFEVTRDFASSALPLEEGERVVGIRHRDLAAAAAARPTAYDFAAWRAELESVVQLGAFRTVQRNLITGDGRGEPVEVAEISASAFVLTRVPPLLGRTLVADDEGEGAARVVVIGHDVWRTRFASDPAVVGREVRLGNTVHTVVGVMPEGYAFPVSHALWVPLHLGSPGQYEPGEGPELTVFGRLARGATLGKAQAELAAIGQRAAAAFPETHERLRPQVVPYTRLFFGGGASQLYLVELVFVLVLVLIGANVATLVFARTATREWEIAVRTALGASRERIVMQFFAEALVLALAAAAVGLAAVRWGSQRAIGVVWRALDGQAPFWWDDGLAPATVLYAAALAVLAAVVVGVVPALRATGPRVQARLQRAATGGSGMRLGGLWTGVLVTQVAFSVAILPLGIAFVHTWLRTQSADPGFPADEYLAVRLELDGATVPGAAPAPDALARFQATVQELKRRVAAEPGVTGVTFADRFPGMNHRTRRIEVEGAAPHADGRGTSEQVFGARREIEPDARAGAHEVQTAAVDIDFFDVLGAPILSGRGFRTADLGSDARVVIVNESFVREVLRGGSAVGRRVRYATRSDDEAQDPWHEIVGVVMNLAMDRDGLNPGMPAGMYHPLPAAALIPECCEVAQQFANDDAYTVRMAVHVRGDPAALAPRLRRIATALEPELRLHDLHPLDARVGVTEGVHLVNALIVWAFALMVVIALLVSASGTYALMSFTVARRAREIAIRAALGAGPRRIVTGIFSRALAQIGLGVGLGVLAWALLFTALAVPGSSSPPPDGAADGGVPWQVAAVVAIMTLVGLIACGVPARRALRIQPTEALRES